MSDGPRLRVSIVFLVLANLVPVFGVLFLDWDVFYILLLFWCENVIIGIFGILRMLSSGGSIFLAAFFTVHYGGFMFGHLMVLFGIFSDSEPATFLERVSNPPALVALLTLFVSHGWSYFANYLGTEERMRLTANQAMAQPYRRMMITHIALIFGGFLLTTTGQPVAGLLLLVGMKIVLDAHFHRREHRTVAF